MKITILLFTALLFISESNASNRKHKLPKGAFDYTMVGVNNDSDIDGDLDDQGLDAGEADEDISIEDLLSVVLLGHSKTVKQYCSENLIRAKIMAKKSSRFSRKGKGLKKQLRSYMNKVKAIIPQLDEMGGEISHAQSTKEYRNIINYIMNAFGKCKLINNIGVK